MTMTDTISAPTDADLQLFCVPEVMSRLKLSRDEIYKQIRAKRLRSVKQGRRRLVSATALRDYIHLLEQESASAN
jgi:excisionase family DNA binding protein